MYNSRKYVIIAPVILGAFCLKNIVYKVLVFVIIVATLAVPLVACDDLGLVEYELTILSLPEKKEYYLGENVLLDGLKVKVNNTLTGEDEEVSTFYNDERFSFSGYDNETPGEKTITVIYTVDGISAYASFKVTVLDVWLEQAKNNLDISELVTTTAADAARMAYAGGPITTEDIESDIYVEIGESKTPISISPQGAYVANDVEDTLYRRYFEFGEEHSSQYAPIRVIDNKISIAWVTLMTLHFTVRISGYDTIYTYEYPYTEQLEVQVIDGRFVKFVEKPPIDYCYVSNDERLSVETIKHITDPVDCYCIEIKDGTVQNGKITLYVSGYERLVVNL